MPEQLYLERREVPFIVGEAVSDTGARLVAKLYAEASALTGSYVQIVPDYLHLPFLQGNDNVPICLYEFIEALDGLLDYEQMLERFPTLSYSQIGGAMAFIRRIAQFNTRGIDIDDLQDQEDSRDLELIEQLRTSLTDKETACVLDFDQSNSPSGIG